MSEPDSNSQKAPELATGDTAAEILETVERRSESFGTTIRKEGAVGSVEL